MKRAFRIATLVVPSWLAWYVAFSTPHRDTLARAVTFALGPLWVLLAGALIVRTVSVVLDLVRGKGRGAPVLARFDVLTGAGSALAWASAFAIMGAVWLGYASLAAVGLLGAGVFHVVVVIALAAFRKGAPVYGASITRRFSPAIATEGDDVVEEIRLEGVRVPLGFRMFVAGRVGPRWATSRHVLDAAESGADVVLESNIGPAARGDHDAEPLEVWLEDTFGLCRSVPAEVGPARLTVLPRLPAIERTASLLGRGIGPRAPRSASRLPSEGIFQLREYQAGDDVRRIHWVRSLAAGELIVRLPDEVPPDRPRVRLVLDTFFPEVFALACDSPSELLDSVVAVWLAVGRTLAESGVRVTLVAAVPDADGEGVVTVQHDLTARATGAALRLGARVVWQNRMPVNELLTDEATFVVSRGVLVPPPSDGHARWILVPPQISPDLPWPFTSSTRLPYPMGSADNRWSRRRRVVDRLVRARRDHAIAMLAMRRNVAPAPPGSFAAFPVEDGTVRLEALR